MLESKHLLILLLSVTVAATATEACDLCGCYTPQLETETLAPPEKLPGQPMNLSIESWRNRIYLAVGEQFTYFNTLLIDGREVPNPTDQYLASSVTQLVAGYEISSRFALQVNVPLIYRSFQRPEGFTIDRGTESGLGDVSLLLKTVLFHYHSSGRRDFHYDEQRKQPIAIERAPDFTASVVLFTGVKFPTGDTSRIKEEFHEVDVEGAPQSGIHGHDLTLGTGSYDGIFGGEGSLRYKSLFFLADTQFTLRGDGMHQYHFANDFAWSAGPGFYFLRKPNAVLGLQFLAAGEYKDVDRFEGKPAEDTGITSVSLGPRVIASFGKVSAEIGAEFPVFIHNTSFQAVPDYRLLGGISIRF